MNLIKDEYEAEYNIAGLKNLRGKTLKYKKHQIGSSVRAIDAARHGLPAGKRLSRNGKIYYEYRQNRSDLKGSNV